MTERQWEARRPLASPRCYAAVLTYSGELAMLKQDYTNVIFLVGGCDRAGIPVADVDMYFPDRNFWFPRAPMAVARASPICAILNTHYILSLGGVLKDPPQAPSAAIEIYDIRQNIWFQISPSMEKPLMGMASLVKDNTLLIFGGMQRDTNPTDTAHQVTLKVLTDYHHHNVAAKQENSEWGFFTAIENIVESLTEADEPTMPSKPEDFQVLWKPLPFMPNARYSATALDFGNRIAVVGGRVGKTPVSKFDVYDLSTGLWKQFPDHPGNRVFMQIVKLHERIFVIGGLNQPATQGFCQEVNFYDMNEDTEGKWRSASKLRYKRGDFAAFVNNCTNIKTIDGPEDAEASTPITPEEAKSLSKIPNNINDEIIVCGGLGENNGAKALQQCEVLTVSRESGPRKNWKLLPALPEGRGTAMHVRCGDYMYLIGGILMHQTGDGGPTGMVHRFPV